MVLWLIFLVLTVLFGYASARARNRNATPELKTAAYVAFIVMVVLTVLLSVRFIRYGLNHAERWLT